MQLKSYSSLLMPLAVLTLAGCQATSLEEGALEPVRKHLGSTSSRASDDRPNIIFILSDDQDRSSLEAMPRLGRLFPDRFPQQIITTPLCCPSRETALTGQYAHNHGVFSNLPQRGYLPDGRPFGGWEAAGSRNQNVGRWLRRSGYYTALIGKYLNGFDYGRPIPAGWDYFVGALEDEDKGYFNYVLNENGKLRRYGEDAEQYSINVLVERIKVALLNAEKADKPAFILFTPPTPHVGSFSSREPTFSPEPAPQERGAELPFVIPKPSDAPAYNEADMSDKPDHVAGLPRLSQEEEETLQRLQVSRWLSLLSLDREIAELVRFVDRGRRRNYFFYSTDNGFLLGEHRLRAKKFPYEASINFPLLVRTPKAEGADEFRGREHRELIANLDVVPTILDLAHARPPEDWTLDGRSLLPLIDGRGGAGAWRGSVLIEGFPLGVEEPESASYRPYLGIRTLNEVFVRYYRPGAWPMRATNDFEYYRLDRDPWQLTNLAADPAFEKRIRELERLSEKLADCRGTHCWTASVP